MRVCVLTNAEMFEDLQRAMNVLEMSEDMQLCLRKKVRKIKSMSEDMQMCLWKQEESKKNRESMCVCVLVAEDN